MDEFIRAKAITFFGTTCMVARYKPTLPDNAAEQRFRKNLLDLLRKRPMSSKKALIERLDCSPGTMTHHLRVLETCNLVQSRQVGRHTRISLTDCDPQQVEAIGLLREKPILDLARLVLECPGAKQYEITSALGMSRKMARAYIDRLVAAGLIQEENSGRCLHYHPTPSLEEALRSVEKDDPLRDASRADDEENVPPLNREITA